MKQWFEEWFNEDYLALYAYRNQEEAEKHVEKAITTLGLKGNETILDLGCGAGRHAAEFVKRGYNVTGVDLSDTLLNIAKENVAATFLKRDMRDLGNIGPFDCIVNFFTTFGYFEDPKDDLKVLMEIRRCLKLDGKVWMDVATLPIELIPSSELTVNGQTVHITRRQEGNIVIKTIQFPHKTYEERVRLYTQEELAALFKQAGLEKHP